MFATVALLAASICAVWAPPIRLRRVVAPPWALLFISALVSGLVYGLITPTGLAALGLLAGACVLAQHAWDPRTRAALTAIAGVIAVTLALHIVPGFNNPVVLSAVMVSDGAPPFTQYASVDKAAAGLLILVFFCCLSTTAEHWRAAAFPTVLGVCVTPFVVISAALIGGYVAFDPKFPRFSASFLVINLLFTCVAEEAFFRGLLQERLSRRWPQAQWPVITASALLFGIAHFAGGAWTVALATLAGLAYALVYAVTRRIEAPILTHFAVNAVHFFGFTYPRLA